MSSVHRHLDEAVERLSRLRDELLADECAPDRLSMAMGKSSLMARCRSPLVAR